MHKNFLIAVLSTLLITSLEAVPVVTGVSPNFGPTDMPNSVTITGSGFTGATQVSFGSQVLTGGSFTVDTDSQISVPVIPGQVPGSVDVRVTAGTQSAITPFDQFTYQGAPFAYVTSGNNNGNPDIGSFDLVINGVIAFISSSGGPTTGIVVTNDRKTAYVGNGNTATGIDVVDLFTFSIVDTIATGSTTNELALTPDGTKLLVTNAQLVGTVTIIDTQNPVSQVVVPVGTLPQGIAVTPDGLFAYVVNAGNTTVSVIDLTLNIVTQTLSFGSALKEVSLSPDGLFVYVTDSNAAVVHVIDRQNGNSVDTVAGSPIAVGASPLGIAVAPNNTFAYAVNTTDQTASKIDLSNNSASTTGTLDADGSYVAIHPSSSRAYITAADSHIKVIDTATNALLPIEISTKSILTPKFIAITPDQAPAAQFQATGMQTGVPTQFDASLSQTASGIITDYFWDFGDGNTESTSASVIEHTYTTPGNYLVTLTLTNSNGTSVTQTFTGQMTSNQGNERARTSQLITISSAEPPSIDAPSKFHGKLKKKHHHRLVLKTKWKASPSQNIAGYEVYENGVLIHLKNAAKKLVFCKHQHPDSYYKKHEKKYRKFLHKRYQIRAVSTTGATSDFVKLKVKKN